MDTLWKPDKDFEQRMASRMLDVLIRAALGGSAVRISEGVLHV